MPAPRTQAVDALRSFALFGICVVNIPFLAQPVTAEITTFHTGIDQIVQVGIELLFQGKFFLVFSFLFGWGFGKQLTRPGLDVATVRRRFLARLGALAVFGLAHALLVFHGDILLLYAVLGVGLWAVRDLSPRALLRVAAGAILVGAGVLMLLAAVVAAESEAVAPVVPGYLGGIGDIIGARVADWTVTFPFIVMFNGPLAFGAFALGLAAEKSGFFDPGSPARGRFHRVLPWLIIPAAAGNVAYAMAASGALGDSWPAALGFAALAFGGPALSALYLAGVLWLADRLPAHLWAVGGLSMTAYIAEGVIAGLIFNGVGLGLYGTMGPAALFAVAVGVFGMTHILCHLWLLWQPVGPVERAFAALQRRLAG
jgi:uncharacterized protein